MILKEAQGQKRFQELIFVDYMSQHYFPQPNTSLLDLWCHATHLIK